MSRNADADGTGNVADDGVRTLDARTVDGAPFDAIVAALDDLDDGERLVLVNGFEPEPLYDVLERRGFSYETEQVAETEWRVTIQHV